MAAISALMGMQKDVRSFSPDERFVLPETRIGIEFEFEGVRNNILPASEKYSDMWQFHRDDSLKNNGAEYVFAEPMFGKDAYNAVEWMVKYANTSEWLCTNRTGLHVHLDIRDLEHQQLIGLITLYAIVEPLLFKWIGDNREHNIHCVPFYKADDTIVEAINIARAFIEDDKTGARNGGAVADRFGRYSALNLKAIADHGSVEFRHMKTTKDFQRVLKWINMLMCLKAATYKLPTSDGAIVRMAESMDTSMFLNYVFGDLAKEFDQATAKELIEDYGILSAKDLAFHTWKQHKSWKSTVEKFPSGKNKLFAKFLEITKDKEQEIPNKVPAPPGFVQFDDFGHAQVNLGHQVNDWLQAPPFIVQENPVNIELEALRAQQIAENQRNEIQAGIDNRLVRAQQELLRERARAAIVRANGPRGAGRIPNQIQNPVR